MPQRHSEALREALQKANVPVTLTIIKGGGHGFQGAALESANVQSAAFFDQHLKQ